MTAKSFVFHVAGTPRPQPRPRFIKGRAVSTASPKAKLWRTAVERAIKCAISASQRATPLFTGPVRVFATFAFEPASPDLIDKPHTHKPDGDNLMKLIQDVMERCGVVKNDSQIARVEPVKWWGSKPGVAVLIEDASEDRRAPIAPTAADAPGWLTGGA